MFGSETVKKVLEVADRISAGTAIILIVGFLLWRDTERDKALDLVQATRDEHAEIIQHAERQEDLTGRTYMATERVFAVLQAMCRNQARTELAVARCEDAGLQILRRAGGVEP